MRRLIPIVAILWSLTGVAQQRREGLRVQLQLAPAATAGTTAVAVRLVNITERTVNVWMPTHLDCNARPGSVSLHWKYKGDGTNSAHSVEETESVCPASVHSPVGSVGNWLHLAPGHFVELNELIQTGAMIPGRYEVRALYAAPKFDSDQRSQLRYAGVETPKGAYEGSAVQFLVEGEGDGH